MNSKQIWQAVQGEMEVNLSKANYTTWFKDTFLYDHDETSVTIGVPNLFTEDWFKKKYESDIKKIIKKLIPKLNTINYKVVSKNNIEPEEKSKTSEKKTKKNTHIESNRSAEEDCYIDTKYSFDNFVVGNSNKLAYATALAIAREPGAKYNPFFIYGGVGLGKTHLMQAVGNEIKKKNSKKKILYVSCEDFTNEYVGSIQNRKMNEFKKKYRNIDVLLIDDIQFLSSKDGTQEEFFHTFNTLHRAKRQIIMTADKRPQDLEEVANRLTSRFAWGMVADVTTPDMETRKAIVAKKFMENMLDMDDEVIGFIAENIESNIRELEGAVNKIRTHSEIYQKPICLKLATEVLQENINNSRTKNISCDKIIKIVAQFYQVDKKELAGKRRYKELVLPRQVIMYLLRNELNYSFPRIGKELGGKDHTTIMHGAAKIDKALKRDMQLQSEITTIKEKLYI